jgi:hypothetical protein
MNETPVKNNNKYYELNMLDQVKQRAGNSYKNEMEVWKTA